MIDAFLILGAKPTDSVERLNELLEDKELLLDDISAVQSAYADLTNSKKRLKHEIMHYCSDVFLPFRKLITAEKKATAAVHADVFVNLGHWFEYDHWDLFERINDNRSQGGYAQIDNESTFFGAMEEIKHEFIISANSYFDSLTQKNSLAKIFNAIVRVPNFTSFFIDELMAQYELALSEILQEKEHECLKRFSEIENICTDYNDGAPLSSSLSWIVTKFDETLKDWDYCAQPLQKNAQVHGGQHENSEKLVYDIRNRVIAVCNSSQEKLVKLIQQLNVDITFNHYSSALDERAKLTTQIPDNLKLTEALIKIMDTLKQVFSELEITAEQLSQDQDDLRRLKDALLKWNTPLQEAKRREEQNKISEQRKSTICRIVHGVISAICFVVMIVGFSLSINPLGVVFLTYGAAFGCCCGFYPWLEDKGIMKWIIIGAIILGAILGTLVGAAGSGST